MIRPANSFRLSSFQRRKKKRMKRQIKHKESSNRYTKILQHFDLSFELQDLKTQSKGEKKKEEKKQQDTEIIQFLSLSKLPKKRQNSMTDFERSLITTRRTHSSVITKKITWIALFAYFFFHHPLQRHTIIEVEVNLVYYLKLPPI